MRSRAVSLPRLRCRATAAAPPPSCARARRVRRSSTNADIARALRSKSGDAASIRLARILTLADLSPCENIHPGERPGRPAGYDPLVAAQTTAPATFRPVGTLDAATALAPYSGPGTRVLPRICCGGPDSGAHRLCRAAGRALAQAAVDTFVRFPNTSSLSNGPELETPRSPRPALSRFRRRHAADSETADRRKAFRCSATPRAAAI